MPLPTPHHGLRPLWPSSPALSFSHTLFSCFSSLLTLPFSFLPLWQFSLWTHNLPVVVKGKAKHSLPSSPPGSCPSLCVFSELILSFHRQHFLLSLHSQAPHHLGPVPNSGPGTISGKSYQHPHCHSILFIFNLLVLTSSRSGMKSHQGITELSPKWPAVFAVMASLHCFPLDCSWLRDYESPVM